MLNNELGALFIAHLVNHELLSLQNHFNQIGYTPVLFILIKY